MTVTLALAACRGGPSVYDPQGPAAGQIDRLNLWLTGLGLAVYGGVCLFLLLALFRRRRGDHAHPMENPPAPYDEMAGGATARRIIIGGGIVMPVAVLMGVVVLTLSTLVGLAAMERDPDLTVTVTGHQWWWEVEYPERGVVTANEIHIPVGQRVRIHLEAQDVIHSFWVPQLHGKLDMIPGQRNSFTIQADAAGEYRGLCAEFCGSQHARMLFLVVAQPPQAFDTWVAAQRAAAPEPAAAAAQQGKELFFDATCDECHAIAGTEATGRLGPDLTHFAGRREIGAGIVENNRQNLAAWIRTPQTLKPNALMPNTTLSDPELEQLVTYLETLE